jgi:phosphoenolpyruvate synthase/pyruvate phosphate dikinase
MGGNGRFVYGFDEPAEGGRELLGGKGVGLAEMTQLGVPVPAGFTITTDACRAYMRNGQQLPDGLGARDRRAPERARAQDLASASATRATRCSSPCARERRSRCRG